MVVISELRIQSQEDKKFKVISATQQVQGRFGLYETLAQTDRQTDVYIGRKQNRVAKALG